MGRVGGMVAGRGQRDKGGGESDILLFPLKNIFKKSSYKLANAVNSKPSRIRLYLNRRGV
jgi:hypothetical protein